MPSVSLSMTRPADAPGTSDWPCQTRSVLKRQRQSSSSLSFTQSRHVGKVGRMFGSSQRDNVRPNDNPHISSVFRHAGAGIAHLVERRTT